MMSFMETTKAQKDTVFGNRLKQARKRAGMTQTVIVERLGVMGFDMTQGAYSHYERGARYPDPPLMRAMADITETSLDYLSGGTDIDSPMAEIEEELAAVSGNSKLNRLMEKLPKEKQQSVISYAEFLLANQVRDTLSSPPTQGVQRGVSAIFSVMQRRMDQSEINGIIDEVLEEVPEWRNLIIRHQKSSARGTSSKDAGLQG